MCNWATMASDDRFASGASGKWAPLRPSASTRNAGVVILVVPKETSSDGKAVTRVKQGKAAGFITDTPTQATSAGRPRWQRDCSSD